MGEREGVTAGEGERESEERERRERAKSESEGKFLKEAVIKDNIYNK